RGSVMQHFLIKRADGSVWIMIALDDATCEDEIAKWSPEDQAQIVSHEPIDVTAIPKDRYFRNAWTSTAKGKLAVNMAKARDIHREVLRRMRAPLLAQADIDYMMADEVGDAVAKGLVRKRKQALRDAPQDPRIDAAKTPEKLKAIIPDVLKT